MTLSVVVPCHNEAEALPVFVDRLLPVLERLDVDREVILVDDGSRDETLVVMRHLCELQGFHYVSLSRNFGKEAALLVGLEMSSGECVAIMDADCQDPPESLPAMLSPVMSGQCDCCVAVRDRKGEPLFLSLCARLYYALMSLISDIRMTSGVRDFRVMNRRYVEAVLSLPEYGRFMKGVGPLVGFEVMQHVYGNEERVAGRSKWNFLSLARYAVLSAVHWSNLLVICSGVLVLVSLLASIITTACQPFHPLLLFGSICYVSIMTMLWIMSLYINDIHKEVLRRPKYFIRETDIKKHETGGDGHGRHDED